MIKAAQKKITSQHDLLTPDEFNQLRQSLAAANDGITLPERLRIEVLKQPDWLKPDEFHLSDHSGLLKYPPLKSAAVDEWIKSLDKTSALPATGLTDH